MFAGALVVLAAVAIAAALAPAVSGGAELDVTAAQAGVQQVLTDPIDGYGRDDISDVRCNGGKNPAAKRGTGFSCLVRVDGVDREVSVIVVDNHGTYEVDQPR